MKSLIFFFRKMSHSAKNLKNGTLLDLLTCILLQNIKKLEEGTLWLQKNFEKKSHSAEKNQRGDSLVPSGFVGCFEKEKNETGDPLD